MNLKQTRLRAIAIVSTVTLFVPVAAFAQFDWGAVVKTAQRIELSQHTMEGNIAGVGSGEVAEGFASFVFDLDYAGPLSLEVDVTEVRRGTDYEDDDSMLFFFNEDGYLLDENDDSPFGGLASLINGTPIDGPGTYYAVVTTLPNSPDIGPDGRFVELGEEGGSSIAFDLIVWYGALEGDDNIFTDDYDYDDWGGGETVFWFDEIKAMAQPLFYDGGDLAARGSVSTGIEVFQLNVAETTNLSIEVVVTAAAGYGDSVLFVFDEDGYFIAEDDDGGYDSASFLGGIYFEPDIDYYIVVASFPNYPNVDFDNYLEGFPETGEDDFEFDLVFAPGSDFGDVGDYGDYGGEPYPDDGVPANSFSDIVANAQYIPVSNMRGIGAGEVGVGYAAFQIEVDEPLYATIEVVVTEVRQGVSYADSDSVLFIFDESGTLIAHDDDGGVESASKIESVWLENPGRYYVVVGTFPNAPELDGSRFVRFDTLGESNIAFDLVVRLDTAAM